jgi:hypothetical protein
MLIFSFLITVQIIFAEEKDNLELEILQDHYEGFFEGFDIADYMKIQTQMMEFEDLQRSKFSKFGNINKGPESPGVAKSHINRIKILMQMIMFLQE